MATIHFAPRWKEEIVASSSEGKLVFEFTMGRDHVYFPAKEMWEQSAPAWAKEKWELYFTECSRWCTNNGVPITLVDNGYMYEEK